MFAAASLILVGGIVVVSTPHTVQAVKVWCVITQGSSTPQCSGFGFQTLEKNTDCKAYTASTLASDVCKKLDPTRPTH